MQKDHINYFLVGVFSLTGILIFVFMLFQMSAGRSLSDPYYTEFSNVSGVRDGTTVTFNGYEIGSVTSVEPVFDNMGTIYRVHIAIRSGWRLPVESQAKIVMPAMIADKQIDISTDSKLRLDRPDAVETANPQVLSPGDKIRSLESVDVMQLVDSLAQQLNEFVPKSTQDVSQLLQRLNYSADQVALIFSDKNVRHLNNLFQHADNSSENLAELVNSFNRVNEQLNKILNKTDNLIDENSEDVRYSVLELKHSIDAISSRIESIMYNVESTSQNMNEFSRQIRHHPSSLLGSEAPKDKHNE